MGLFGEFDIKNKRLFFFLGLLLSILIYLYALKNSEIESHSLIKLNIIPLLLGVVYESRKLSSSWIDIGLKLVISFICSFFAVLAFKEYPDQKRILLIPISFVLIFSLISTIYHRSKLTPSLGEGITLLQTISIVYFFIDSYSIHQMIFGLFFMIISIPFCLLSIYNAFASRVLSNKSRLFLSIWSSIVMMVFGAFYIIRVFALTLNDHIKFENIINFIQYFFLGISIMYFLHNSYMLLVYLPSKGRFFNKQYREEVTAMNKNHIKRYSTVQVALSDSFFVLIFSVSIFVINFLYNLLPSYTMIWIIFWLIPILIFFKKYFVQSN